jgi:NAD+ synthase
MLFFEEFRKMGADNCERIIEQAVKFIIKKQTDPVTGEILPAIIGLSGGVDSSVVAALTVKALGRDKVFGYMLPYIGMSSKESIEDATELARQLGMAKPKKIPINDAVDSFVRMNEPKPGAGIGSYRKGNAMARIRMTVLYDKAMEYGGRVLDTCNLTEVMVGFFTKHGDGASDYNAVRYIYKTWIWELARYMKLPEKIINKAPSAELEFGQTDEGDMGITYRALDLLLWLLYDKNVYAGRILDDYGFSNEIMKFVIDKVNASQHKRDPVPVCRIYLPEK